MGRPKLSESLGVFMNGEEVGRLTTRKELEFVYADPWLDSDSPRPLSLSMPLTSQPYRGAVVANFFDNLLPDSRKVRDRIQARFRTRSDSTFDLLSEVGRDCVGALQLLPDGEVPGDFRRIVATPVTEGEIAEVLRNRFTDPLGMGEEGDFRISIAGVQDKTALLLFKGVWHRPGEATPTSHILKPPIGRLRYDLSDSVENEWLCHAILKAYAMEVADAEIMTFEDEKALVVKRFDRRWSSEGKWLIRLPQEDLCQALGVSAANKYESDGGPDIPSIVQLLRGSNKSFADMRTFFKAQLLFWLLAAPDGHAKNFSIFLLPAGGFHLTPLYDVMSAHPLIESGEFPSRKLKMALSVRGQSRHYHWERMLPRHWLSTARLCRFPEEEISMIVDEVLGRVEEVIEKVGKALPVGFPERLALSIFAGMRAARERF